MPNILITLYTEPSTGFRRLLDPVGHFAGVFSRVGLARGIDDQRPVRLDDDT